MSGFIAFLKRLFGREANKKPISEVQGLNPYEIHLSGMWSTPEVGSLGDACHGDDDLASIEATSISSHAWQLRQDRYHRMFGTRARYRNN